MPKYSRNYGCIQCEIPIDNRVYEYSLEHYSHPLCRTCQKWLVSILEETSATDYAIELYFALKIRNVPAKLEKSDGFKSIDIAVPSAKVNIEVDGKHHNYDGKTALCDLQRTLHSLKKGYSTLRIPNSLTKYDLDQTANLIKQYLAVNKRRERRDWY